MDRCGDENRVPRPGDHGLPDGREPGWRRARGDRLESHDGHRRSVCRAASVGSGRADAPRRRRRGGGRPDDGRRRTPGRERCCSVPTAPPTGPRRAPCSSTPRRLGPVRRGYRSTLGNHGFAFLDAPVTGSSPRAEDGTLTFMVGGDRSEFERARPGAGGNGQGDRLRRRAGPGTGRQGDQQHGRGGQRGDAGPGTAGGRRRGCRPRRSGGRDGRRVRRLGDARPQGHADAHARLHDAVEGRSATC